MPSIICCCNKVGCKHSLKLDDKSEKIRSLSFSHCSSKQRPNVNKNFLEDQHDLESQSIYKNKLLCGLMGSVGSVEDECKVSLDKYQPNPKSLYFHVHTRAHSIGFDNLNDKKLENILSSSL